MQTVGPITNVNMGFKHAIHVRVNDWKIGDYDSHVRQGEIVVGQLCSIDKDSGYGHFRGFVMNDTQGKGREYQAREWKHYLRLSKPPQINKTYIARYERYLEERNKK